jgi:hypothetical protein
MEVRWVGHVTTNRGEEKYIREHLKGEDERILWEFSVKDQYGSV